ncbi:MAG TPA: TIM barrel protein [Candidatus Dormibacteraeota bacterium]|nr:TIM barrel protein [Candidatus Dormibacteraeota bacterium]
MNATVLSRRSALKRFSGALALGAAGLSLETRAAEDGGAYKARNGRVQQSVIYWCFKPMTVDELAHHASAMGVKSVELVPTENWPMLKKLGLACAMTPSHGFAKGFAHKEEHAECLDILRKRIDDSADAGFPNVITFSGFRRGISEEDGMKNMVAGLKQIVGYAEKKNVTVCLEMLNSRVKIEMKGHPDYFCDRMDKAVEICRQIGSERMKVLFDIYHVQIMDGDLITRIKQYHPYIGHYHTAGVPGRGELDESQEINYKAVMNTIVETGYKGFVGQEFIPTRDKVASLSEAVKLCDV